MQVKATDKRFGYTTVNQQKRRIKFSQSNADRKVQRFYRPRNSAAPAASKKISLEEIPMLVIMSLVLIVTTILMLIISVEVSGTDDKL